MNEEPYIWVRSQLWVRGNGEVRGAMKHEWAAQDAGSEEARGEISLKMKQGQV